uniref:Ig-like domain-containing protein n=1 Tax=Panagrellus redivivus TaxID=6233 RepID=A0A7E4VAE2_PANRE
MSTKTRNVSLMGVNIRLRQCNTIDSHEKCLPVAFHHVFKVPISTNCSFWVSIIVCCFPKASLCKLLPNLPSRLRYLPRLAFLDPIDPTYVATVLTLRELQLPLTITMHDKADSTLLSKSDPTMLNKSEVSNTDTRSGRSQKGRKGIEWVLYGLLALVILTLIGGADGVECFRKTRNGNTSDNCTGDFCFKLVFLDKTVLLNCINGTDPAYDWNGENSTVTPDGTAYKCFSSGCNNSISSAPSQVSLCAVVMIALFHFLS